eukprot:3958387-Prymnesium_polylepis.1
MFPVGHVSAVPSVYASLPHTVSTPLDCRLPVVGSPSISGKQRQRTWRARWGERAPAPKSAHGRGGAAVRPAGLSDRSPSLEASLGARSAREGVGQVTWRRGSHHVGHEHMETRFLRRAAHIRALDSPCMG